MQAVQLTPVFAAELDGIDLAMPEPEMPYDEVQAAFDRYAVCVIHNPMAPTTEQHVGFAAHFGPLEITNRVGRNFDNARFFHPAMVDSTNLGPDGEILPEGDMKRAFQKGNELWHTDSSFKPVRAAYSMLAAHEIATSGGDTQFADMRAAYDALPAAMKVRIADLVAEHSVWYSRSLGGFPAPTQAELESQPGARHRLVQTHPRSGRKHLYLAAHASHVVGMPLEEGRALLRELSEFATQPRFVYTHKWRLGDLVIWDNRCTMHRVTPFESLTIRRDMRRVTTRDAAA